MSSIDRIKAIRARITELRSDKYDSSAEAKINELQEDQIRLIAEIKGAA